MPIWLIDVLYNFVGIPLMHVATVIRASWDVKARRRVRGSREATKLVSKLKKPLTHRLWFHASSMGEFEQLVPVIKRVKQHDSDLQVVVSIFSPSGIDHARNNSDVDLAVYLPWDYPLSMKSFAHQVGASVLIIDRYDLWRNLVLQTSSQCPVIVANATAPSMASSSSFRDWLADTYSRASIIHAVSESDSEILRALSPTVEVIVTPDSRVDRVLDATKMSEGIHAWKAEGRTTIVLGSTWSADEDLWHQLVDHSQNIRLIIVPHEPTDENVLRLCSQFNAVRWSTSKPSNNTHVIVDVMGSLLQIYGLADAAYVGGGFGAGIHSISEPAGYGIPLACGPKLARSREGVALHELGGLSILEKPEDVSLWIDSVVRNPDNRQKQSSIVVDYMARNTGGTAAVTHSIYRVIGHQL